MSRSLLLGLATLLLALPACRPDPAPATLLGDMAGSASAGSRAGGFRNVSFPDQDPGAPFYARVSTILNQIFHDGEHVAIPFYRDPACVPADFNLLDAFDPPGPNGPGAFACPLLVSGRFLIEPDAPLGTFPLQVTTHGPAQVWFVQWTDFQAAMADGVVTMAELTALQPLRGVANQFNEMLQPRMENHHVVITSQGRLDDGRRFQFNVNHPGDATQSILIRIR
jgi:hypothetical protein